MANQLLGFKDLKKRKIEQYACLGKLSRKDMVFERRKITFRRKEHYDCKHLIFKIDA